MLNIKRVVKIDLFKFIYYNFLCRAVIRKKRCYIIPYRHTAIQIDKTAKIILNGTLELNSNKVSGSNAETCLLMREGSVLLVNNGVSIYYRCDIAIFKNGKLCLDGGYINAGSQIRCANYIKIGKGFAISRDVQIWDADHHSIEDEISSISKNEVVIGDHVWIGSRAMV